MPEQLATRITPESLHGKLDRCQFYVFPGTRTTICCLTTKTGYSVIGSSTCIHDIDFEAELGETYARQDADLKLRNLEVYLLKAKLHQQELDNEV